MAKRQTRKLVQAITSQEENFAQWYTDICVKGRAWWSTPVSKGFIILRPYGQAIWELIQKDMDARFKATGHENVAMPIFIPESLLQKEKDHVEGFAPECAWVTMGGSEKLEERYCIRPTSETLFCEHYANIIHSHRDLPKLYNQWCSVLRWEKTSRPFLRHREFLWQEGHTMHATAEEAIAETERMFNIYADFCENYLAMPVVKGRKDRQRRKFSGAEATYTVECMMHDRRPSRPAPPTTSATASPAPSTSPSPARTTSPHHPFQTSWGVSTRLIGGVIMTHGDNNGLVLPPRIAPTQVIIIPVAQHKEGVIAANEAVMARLKAAGIRVKMDASDNSPGWKFAEYEMKGVPLRLELGPKDIEKNQCVLARRDSGEKVFVSLDNIEETVKTMLDAVQQGLFDKAKRNLDENTYACATLEEVKEKMASQGGFAKTMWCGELACELKMKEEAGVSSRCIPLEQEHLGDTCACCGKPAKHMVYWGVAY